MTRIRKRCFCALAAVFLLLSGCTGVDQDGPPAGAPDSHERSETGVDSRSGEHADSSEQANDEKTVSGVNREGVYVVANTGSLTLLVNKHFKLPDGYKPTDLVQLDVPFIYNEPAERKKMRRPAAEALEKMFAAAKKDGIRLAGVSAYRSHERQASLFNSYASRDGEKEAMTYSARPGTSEHETGLAIDVAGTDSRYAANDAFAETREAKWIAAHASDYGYIVRYPEGKEQITGYKYEAWHLRYVGLPAAKTIMDKGITLEEYVEGVPVAGEAAGD